jgi:hypothetical protein
VNLARLATPADYINGEALAEVAVGAGNPRPPTHRQSTLSVLTWSDMLAEPPEPPPTVADGIPRVGLAVLAGSPKVGKTLRMSQVALEVGRSTMIVEEGSLAGISYRLRHQAAALGIDVPDVAIIHRQRIRLDDRRSVERIREHVAERRPTIVVFDPLNRLHGGDENRPTQMTPVMDALAGIAYDFECAVVAIHHLAKPSAERRGDIWDRFRGATSIRSGTDANLVMDGTGALVHLVGEFRDAEPLSIYLELDRDALIFREVDGPTSSGKIDRDALRQFLAGRDRVTVREVMGRFDVKSKATAIKALEALPGIDWFDGPRNQRSYTLGTVQ